MIFLHQIYVVKGQIDITKQKFGEIKSKADTTALVEENPIVTLLDNSGIFTSGALHLSELAGQVAIFENRIPLLGRFVLSNQSILGSY